MPTLTARALTSGPPLDADVLLVPVGEPAARVPPELARLAPGAASRAIRAVALGDFDGKPGSRLLIHSDAGERVPRVLLAGTGSPAGGTPAALRKALSAAVRDPLFDRVASVAVLADALGSGASLAPRVAAAADGILDGLYRWTAATERRPSAPARLVFVTARAGNVARVEAGLEAGRALGESVGAAKDLGNAPPNRMSPEDLGKAALRLAREHGLDAKVLGPRELAREKMAALLAVGEGSERKPRLIVVRYSPRGAGAQPPVALVGKGIVYDTGGVCIKPMDSMVEMKYDKCGGCVVLAAIAAAARLRLPVPLVAVVPAAENLISGSAYRAGDIVGSRAGKSIEVLNTDAEGRLVLADAIDYAITEHAPQAVVDVATLTGAAYYALGDHACALFGTDEALLARLRAAGDRAGESAWPLPLTDEYRADVQTPNADVRNTSAWGAGAVAGASFLQRFVRGVPWAHLDVASVSRDRRNPARGATGFGVRLLVEALRAWPRARRARRAVRPRTRRR